MSDLISRKAVLDEIHKYFRERIDHGIYEVDVVDCNAHISKRIYKLPTAFDVDKVVEQLETYKNIMQSNMESSGHDGMAREYYRGRKSAAIDFLEIMKGAVKDEN